METSTWKCSARRTRGGGGIQHNQTIGICPGDFPIQDFSIPVTPPSVLTAVLVTVPRPRCAQGEEAPCPTHHPQQDASGALRSRGSSEVEHLENPLSGQVLKRGGRRGRHLSRDECGCYCLLGAVLKCKL